MKTHKSRKFYLSPPYTVPNYNKNFKVFIKNFVYLPNEKLFYFSYIIVINLTFFTNLTLILVRAPGPRAQKI
jgi:hypothetical protein